MPWTDPSDSGTLDLATGAVVTETHWDAFRSNLLWLGGATGAMITWTPTLTQSGALTLSASAGRYMRIGNLLVAHFTITINSAGTGGNAITLGGLPVNASSTGRIFGAAFYNDNGTTFYNCFTHLSSTSAIVFVSGGANGFLGAAPSFAAAAGDTLTGGFVYDV